MRGALRVGVARGLVLLGLLSLWPQPGSAREVVQGDADLVQRSLPAVVNIFTRKVGTTSANVASATPDQQVGALQRFYATGFIIDPDGLILTNRHVVDGARQLIVGFNDGSRAIGTVVAGAGAIDLALIKVTTNHKLPVLTLGDSDKMRIGDPVIAIGNPLGVGISVSAGIVSALNRDIQDSPYDDFIQTDAAINHGNSGGPLLNEAGEVIGINSDIFTESGKGGSIGLGFALTSNDAKFIVSRLLQYGRVKAGWIGVEMQDFSPLLADIFGNSDLAGVIVTNVTPGGPAAKAGVVEGDVIEKIGTVVPTDGRDAMRQIGMVPVGEAAHLTLWRSGAERTVDVVTAEIPGIDSSDNPAPRLNQSVMGGLELSTISDQARRTYNFSSAQTGVLVTGVANDVFTGDRTLIPGDLILRVQGTPVQTPDDVHRAIAAARAKGQTLVALLVKDQTGQDWVPLRISGM